MTEEVVPTLPVLNIAKLLGLEKEELHNLRRKKIITAPARKDEWAVTVVKEYCDYLRKQVNPEQAEMDAHAERTRLVKEQADKLEMENAITKNELVRLETTINLWAYLVQNAKNKLLKIPTKSANLLALEDEVAVCKEIIENEILEALNELSKETANSTSEEFVDASSRTVETTH